MSSLQYEKENPGALAARSVCELKAEIGQDVHVHTPRADPPSRSAPLEARRRTEPAVSHADFAAPRICFQSVLCAPLVTSTFRRVADFLADPPP